MGSVSPGATSASQTRTLSSSNRTFEPTGFDAASSAIVASEYLSGSPSPACGGGGGGGGGAPQEAPDLLGVERRIEVAHPERGQRIDGCIHDRWRRPDDAGLAH